VGKIRINSRVPRGGSRLIIGVAKILDVIGKKKFFILIIQLSNK
jgi:hypothetical protein